MTSPLLLVILLGAAQHTGQMSPTSDVSANRVKATGASTARALSTHLRTLPDVSWGAVNITSAVVTSTSGGTRTIASVVADVETIGGRYPRRYPLYVEMVADFNSSGFELPSGYASYVTSQAGNYEITPMEVTGPTGATTLAVSSGPLADFQVTGTGWGAVAHHDDGSWGVYTVTTTSAGGSFVTIRPPLRSPITAGSLTHLHSDVLGQHFTPSGYRALAEHLWRYPGWKAYRQTVIAQAKETAAAATEWVQYGTTGLPRVYSNSNGNYYGAADPLATYAIARQAKHISIIPSAAGQGMQWTQPLYGKTGYVDTYLGAATVNEPAHVEVLIDGVVVLDKYVRGLERIAARFTAATTGTIRITFPQGEAPTTYQWRLGTTTWWELPSDIPASVFFDGAKVVYVGDSWGAFYSGVLPSTLGAHLTATGGSLVNVAVGGMQASWAQTNFDTLITANTPDIVVIEFFVNDYNALGAAGVGTWRARIYDLVNRCLALGIQPVVVMPTPTASATQAQGLAGYGAVLAEGSLTP